MVLILVTERSKWLRKESALQQPPFKEMRLNGFVQSVFLKNNRWWLNDTAYVKLIKCYPVVINSLKNDYAEVLILIKPGYRIFFAEDSGLVIKQPGIVINIALNTLKITSFREVENNITDVINQLQQLQVEPETSVAAYDRYLDQIKWQELAASVGF